MAFLIPCFLSSLRLGHLDLWPGLGVSFRRNPAPVWTWTPGHLDDGQSGESRILTLHIDWRCLWVVNTIVGQDKSDLSPLWMTVILGRSAAALTSAPALTLAVVSQAPPLPPRSSSSSFGDPNAQPPTPRRTPTSAASAAFPSPVFETPKNRQGHFTDPVPSHGHGHGHWTPRFAEEYSVFNTTPGNLRGSERGLFDDHHHQFASLTSTSAHKRQLSAEGIAAEIASHATHFSHPDHDLPPVDPSRTLQSTPTAAAFSEDDNTAAAARGTDAPTPKIRSAKKVKKGKEVERQPPPPEQQTVTPPPSSHKGGRKLAPRLPVDAMQNDQGYGHQDFTAGTSQQQHQPGMAGSFAATDMFGYPMSAPAGPGANFWDPNADLGAMDLDFAAFGHNLFQTTPTQQTPAHSHRSMHSFDATQMFQEPSMPVQAQHISTQALEPAQQSTAKVQRPLAPKAAEHRVETSNVATTSMSSMSFTAPSDDPFFLVSPGAGVDPGLLFSRPPSSSMDTSFTTSRLMDPMTQFSMASVAQALSKPPARSDIRRSNSSRDLAPVRPPDRALASSPLKANGRPGLQRSFSENRGRRNNPPRQQTLPTLAPAIRPNPPLPTSNTIPGPSRPPSSRSTGRTSPLKATHTRLSSLTSIPEATAQRTRTSVKFTIDAKGRARAETTVVVEDPCLVPVAQGRPPLGIPPRRREQSFESRSEYDESSSDDEPIIIPSRNTSFALPDPRKPSGAMFHQSHRSISERSSSSRAGDAESEAETVMDDPRRGAANAGDAASELRKLVESRQSNKRVPQMPQMPPGQRFASNSFAGFPSGGRSPTMSSLLTPSTHAGRSVRCVCHRDGEAELDVFMVQWMFDGAVGRLWLELPTSSPMVLLHALSEGSSQHASADTRPSGVHSIVSVDGVRNGCSWDENSPQLQPAAGKTSGRDSQCPMKSSYLPGLEKGRLLLLRVPTRFTANQVCKVFPAEPICLGLAFLAEYSKREFHEAWY
ncbi:hypothetical protein B0T11DRAFT_321084 [Plectosphaerella cucumerina]|uniref:Uncharacterized protein n=1 Tax=Plectosphaerella cucumerina TaxID=40658 RepID=A0A8K0TDC7_9PEZI|nr:hypothetical protein B0T11DRAFT_321084 [Plectosphaerella cucumerina]